jgi:hypothetical protein
MAKNYFKVGGTRSVRSKLLEAQGDPVEEAATKMQRIMAKKPIPVDFARVFFFDDADPASCLKAWEAARCLSSPSSISVFRSPLAHGPWTGTRVVGEAATAAAN